MKEMCVRDVSFGKALFRKRCGGRWRKDSRDLEMLSSHPNAFREIVPEKSLFLEIAFKKSLKKDSQKALERLEKNATFPRKE